MSENQTVPANGVAIVGMSVRLPGAATPDQFWQNLREGVESTTFFPREELLAAGIDPRQLDDERYIPAKAILDDVESFDAPFFGLPPREAEWMDPQHRVFLQCAWEALEDAGCDPARTDARIGVYAGSAASTYLLSNLLPHPGLLEKMGDIQALLLNDRDFLATRVSYKLDLKGPSVVVQTACSTSLVAVHMACQSLLLSECDMALAGGVSISLPLRSGYLYQEGSILSPDGHTRPFDASAGGATSGDGCGIVVLKRLADALADGDTIHAVILGSAINNDGAGRAGFTAPAIEGQAEVISEALMMAGVEPGSIGYVEAHGSGTALGDPIEVAALTQAFQAAGATDRGTCGLGSVKSNFGHCNTAAGVAGLLKATLALENRTLPPSLGYERPNPQIDFAATPFYVCTRAAPWESAEPRRAGVSSFGLGGTNAHVVLEEAPALEPGDLPARGRQLLVVSARTPAALDAAVERLADHLEGLEAAHPAHLADIAWTLQTGRRGFEHRRAVVAGAPAEAAAALRDPRQGASGRREGTRARPVVFLFPGLGDQYPGMARELYATEPVFREQVDLCAERLAPWLPAEPAGGLREVLFAAGTAGTTGGGTDLRALLRRDGQAVDPAASPLHRTVWAQPACFVVEYALARLLQSWGIEPQALLGYSIGEYVAACVAGALELDDALRLVARRAALIEALPAGAMLAVPLDEEAVRERLAAYPGAASPGLALAATNGPHFCVVAGRSGDVEEMERRLAADGVSCLRLQTTHAFHTPLLEPAAPAFAEIARGAGMQPPRIPYLSNVTGTWIHGDDLADPRYWVRHMTGTVRFAEGLGELLAEPERVYLELGPGGTLGTLVKQHPAAPAGVVTAAALRRAGEGGGDVDALLEAVGRLWTAGVEPDWTLFHGGERRLKVRLPAYPFERLRCWIDPPPPGSRPAAPPEEAAATEVRDAADWFWVPAWKQAPRVVPGGTAREEGPWLLFLDRAGLGERIAARLRAAGAAVATVTPGAAFAETGEGAYTLDPERRQDYDALVGALAAAGRLPARIVHLWGVTEAEPGFAAAQTAGLLSLMYLEQAMSGGGAAGEGRARIALVANGLDEVLDGDPLHPGKATVLGAVPVIRQESAHLAGFCLDVALPSAGPGRDPGWERLAGQVVAELAGPAEGPEEPAVALRGRQRWVRSFEPVRLPTGPPLETEGVYLVTDGLQGPGMALVEHLVRSIAARVAVIVPPHLPPRESWKDRQAPPGVPSGQDLLGGALRRLRALDDDGLLDRVLLVRAEPGGGEGIRDALALARGRFGPVRGVFHTAGVFTGGLIQLKTRESVLAALAPAAGGAEALLAALADEAEPPRFVLLCASALTVTGGLGQLDAAVSGAFLEALALSRARQDGRTDVSAALWDPYQWDSWLAGAGGFGMAAEELQQNLDLFGVSSAASGEALRRLLAARLPRAAVSARDLRELIRSAASVTAASLLEMGAAHGPRETHPRPELSSDYAPPRHEVEEGLVRIWEELFGIAPVGIDDSFLELGGHSLLAIQILTQVRQRLGVELPVTALFETPTIAGLARAVRRARGEEDEEALEALIAQVEGLSAEEVLARIQELGGGLP